VVDSAFHSRAFALILVPCPLAKAEAMTIWKFLFLVTCSLLVVTAAQAGAKDAQRARSARKACLEGDYAKGVSILSDLFLDSKDPTHIYNQGRCLEQNGRFEDAVFRFQEYLRLAPNLSEGDKTEAQKHIMDCQDQLAKRNGQPAADAPAPAALPAPSVAQEPVVSPAVSQPSPPATLQQTNPPPGTEPRSKLRTAGLVTAGGGGVALLAGVVLNLKANSIASSYQDRGGYTRSKESSRKSYETLGWVGYGVGAACVATGAVLYIFGSKAGVSNSSTVVFVPALSPGEAGAVMKGVF
jgi:tetratricopeptide (TPR) repeat protein